MEDSAASIFQSQIKNLKSKIPKLATVITGPHITRPSIINRLRRALRGGVTPRAAALEALRLARGRLARRRERAWLVRTKGALGPARLREEYARLTPAELLAHFRARRAPRLPPGFEEAAGFADAAEIPAAAGRDETLLAAEEIVGAGRWPLLGFGPLDFGADVDWLRDPASGARWPTVHHADATLARGDGSDVRVLWELNRLAHLSTLARAYAFARDERFAAEFFRQLRSWRAQNPLGFGPNWACAMEVALRAANLLAAFRLLAPSRALDADALAFMLALFDEHGAHVRRHLEFSHVRNSNHYLSDVAGLFWLGVCLPELSDAEAWRDLGRRELRREMDGQVLGDGADWEASTGYHRFVTELFLASFVLARENGIELGERHWRRLRSMLEYTRALLRPDGRAPLVGDADGGRFLPLARRAADEHAYLVAVGAAIFDEPRFKVTREAPPELFWLAGSEGVRRYEALPDAPPAESQAFADAGTYVLRAGDSYLLLNASGAGLGGRGSHAHNDALSIEVAYGGACFVRDPGTYVYTADPRERQRFRSTRYHSTVEVDGREQNTTDERLPFVIGDEARPRLLRWEDDASHTLVVAEHDGYRRLPAGPVTHRRSVLFDKRQRFWQIDDALEGRGTHTFRFFFHLAPSTGARVLADTTVEVWDKITGARLHIVPPGDREAPALEPRHSSRDYGAKEDSLAACWTMKAAAPLKARWLLVPSGAGEDADERLKRIKAVVSSQ